MGKTMDRRSVDAYLEMVVDGEEKGLSADLFTDGVHEEWIPHSQIIEKEFIKGRDYKVVMTEFIAIKKGFI